MEDNGVQTTQEETARMEDVYFGLQAELDMTKHIGALDTTNELLELLHIDSNKYVLEVGCGVGRTPAYLAEKLGCRVVAVDIREKMIARSRERAKREGLEHLLEFQVADAQDLPFEDALFDVVMCESVMAMVPDQQKAMSEYVRVVKPGGYVGLNEATWMKEPIPELLQYLARIWGTSFRVHSADGWQQLLEGVGLTDVVARAFPISVRSESASRLKRLGYWNAVKMWGKTLGMLRSRPDYRAFLKEVLSTPKELLEYWGAGLYVGRK